MTKYELANLLQREFRKQAGGDWFTHNDWSVYNDMDGTTIDFIPIAKAVIHENAKRDLATALSKEALIQGSLLMNEQRIREILAEEFDKIGAHRTAQGLRSGVDETTTALIAMRRLWQELAPDLEAPAGVAKPVSVSHRWPSQSW